MFTISFMAQRLFLRRQASQLAPSRAGTRGTFDSGDGGRLAAEVDRRWKWAGECWGWEYVGEFAGPVEEGWMVMTVAMVGRPGR